ncbi:MAG: hypothetical protein ABR584_12680 [Candidatus Baltobacteraceae bacterium]
MLKQLLHPHYQRGQTLPVWGLGVTALLALLFFLGNYVNIFAWHVRAQNAAESAAATALTVQANVFNEESTVLYATAVNENRIRYLNQAILNTINGIGGCSTAPGGSCDQDYKTLVAEYQTAVSSFTGDMQVLQEADNFTQGAQQADQAKAVKTIGSDCAQFDCAFAYNVLDVSTVGGGNGHQSGAITQTDVAVCHNVNYFAAQLMKLNSNAQFTAIGRAAADVQPIASESFSPGTAVNPSTNQVYQPVEAQWASAYPSTAYTVDYSALNVKLNWYGVAHLPPYSGPLKTGGYSCT